jgi:hypothetical protein
MGRPGPRAALKANTRSDGGMLLRAYLNRRVM